jgi:hypothetical protein
MFAAAPQNSYIFLCSLANALESHLAAHPTECSRRIQSRSSPRTCSSSRTFAEVSTRGDATICPASSWPRLTPVGGQVQFRLAGGTCELYWQNFDVAPQRTDETWDVFVARSRSDVAAALQRLPSDDVLLKEGLEFPFLSERAAAGIDVIAGLCFVCYFAAP